VWNTPFPAANVPPILHLPPSIRAVVSALTGIPAEDVSSSSSSYDGGGGDGAAVLSPGRRRAHYMDAVAGALLPPVESLFRMWLATRGPRLREEEVSESKGDVIIECGG